MNSQHNSPRRPSIQSLGLTAAIALIAALTGCDKPSPPTPTTPAAATPPPGNSAGTASANTFVDKSFGFSAAPPSGWRTAPANAVTVPGSVVQVWTPDSVSTIVAFTQQAGQPVTAQQLLDSSSAALKQTGCTVSLEQVTKVGGQEAMSIKLSGPGTGAALGGGGSTPTYQHWIAIPRQSQVLVLLLTTPDANKADAAKKFEAMVASTKID